jgi:hypothetical protein
MCSADSCELPGDLRDAAYRAFPATLSTLSVTSWTWRERLIGDGPNYCGSSDTAGWTTTNGLDGFACLRCHEPHIDLLCEPQSFSLTQRVGGIGPLVVPEVVVGSDVEIHCGELCSAYSLFAVISGIGAGSISGTAFWTSWMGRTWPLFAARDECRR